MTKTCGTTVDIWASSDLSALRVKQLQHMGWRLTKYTVRKRLSNVTNVTLYPLRHVIWGHMLKFNQTIPSLDPLKWTSEDAFVDAKHRGEECNQCDYKFAQACNLRHTWEQSFGNDKTNAPSAAVYPLGKTIWGPIWNCTMEKKKTCTTNNWGWHHYACSNSSIFTTHLKTTGEDKLFKCNHCKYACFGQSALRTHLKTHSGERSNKCN